MTSDALPPVVGAATLPPLLGALSSEPHARSLDLSTARFAEGWENVVVETDDWIIRFPRADEPEAFIREVAILDSIAGRLPVRTPEVAWTGKSVRCMAYPKLIGRQFDRFTYFVGGERERDVLADSMAEVLTGWQAVIAPQAQRLGIESLGVHSHLNDLLPVLAQVPDDVRTDAEQMANAYRAACDAAGEPAVLQADFHLMNMVLDPLTGRVSGLWDFSCVGTGPAAWDVHYTVAELGNPRDATTTAPSLDLATRVLRHWRGEASLAADLRLAVLAMCVEDAADEGPTQVRHVLDYWRPYWDM